MRRFSVPPTPHRTSPDRSLSRPSNTVCRLVDIRPRPAELLHGATRKTAPSRRDVAPIRERTASARCSRFGTIRLQSRTQFLPAKSVAQALRVIAAHLLFIPAISHRNAASPVPSGETSGRPRRREQRTYRIGRTSRRSANSCTSANAESRTRFAGMALDERGLCARIIVQVAPGAGRTKPGCIQPPGRGIAEPDLGRHLARPDGVHDQH